MMIVGPVLAFMFGFSIGSVAAAGNLRAPRVVLGDKLRVGRIYEHYHSMTALEFYGRLLSKQIAHEENEDMIFYVGKFDRNGEYIEKYFWSMEYFFERGDSGEN